MKALFVTLFLTLALSMPVIADRYEYRSHRHHSHDHHRDHSKYHKPRKHRKYSKHHKRKHRKQSRYRHDYRKPYVHSPYYFYGHSGISIGGYVDDDGRWRTVWGITFD